jgi:predicted cobalt transporter CbtA
VPYTIDPEPPGAAEALETRARRWWVASVLANAASMGTAAAGAMFGPRMVAAWLGLLPILTAPLLLVAPALRRFGRRRQKHLHRDRPGRFPPPQGGRA